MLATQLTPQLMRSCQVGLGQWTNERTGAMESLDVAKGFTVEAKTAPMGQPEDEFILRAFARSGNYFALVIPA